MSGISSLKVALDLERKGTIFYLDYAVKSDNPITKKLFYSLAAQEIEHARIVDEISAAKNPAETGIRMTISDAKDIEKTMKSFFGKAKKQFGKIPASQEKAYETAMDMERQSYKIYKEMSESVSGEKDGKFYRALMEQENLHLEALQNIYFYLTRSGDWFEEEESKVWNWMNM